MRTKYNLQIKFFIKFNNFLINILYDHITFIYALLNFTKMLNKYIFTYKTQKYTFNIIFASIIDFMKSGSSYHNYVGIVNSKTSNLS